MSDVCSPSDASDSPQAGSQVQEKAPGDLFGGQHEAMGGHDICTLQETCM